MSVRQTSRSMSVMAFLRLLSDFLFNVQTASQRGERVASHVVEMYDESQLWCSSCAPCGEDQNWSLASLSRTVSKNVLHL